MRLEGKCGIVVGGGQTPGETLGNGKACALLFAREGAKVLVVDRDLGRAEDTAALIRDEGGTAQAFAGDCTKSADCKAYVRACTDAWGKLDFLHNNVGITTGDGLIEQVDEAVFDTVMGVNLKGCFLSCKAALPVMREQGFGSIVNISSTAAISSAPVVVYKMSKAGMNGLGQILAVSYARYGVRVNTVMPGLLDTPMAIAGRKAAGEGEVEAIRARRNAMVPLRGQMGDAWDTARAALFLHSDEAKFITGLAIAVDGGLSAKVGAA